MPMHRFALLLVVALGLGFPAGANAHGGGPHPEPLPSPPPPPTPPAPTPPPATVPKRHSRPASFEDWVFWWHHNADRLEAKVAPRGWVHPDGSTQKLHTALVETLRQAIDEDPARHHVAIRAKAIFALARVTTDPADVGLLVTILEDPARSASEHEAAALGLGLLRRSDPARQFAIPVLDRVRKVLLRTFEATTLGLRTRAFAMLGLGLLGDQPCGPSTAPMGRTLERLLRTEARATDLSVSLLMALGLQSEARPMPLLLENLREAVLKGRFFGSSWNEILRSHAALALGRLGGAEDITVFEKALAQRRGMPKNVQRSSAIALGRLADRLDPEAREKAIRVVLLARKRHKDPSTCHFLVMALVPLTQATDTKATAKLLELARKGRFQEKPYAALALALLARKLSEAPPTKAATTYWKKAQKALERGLANRRNDATVHAAFAVALAVAGSPRAPTALESIIRDESRDRHLRRYALLGLALHPDRGPTRAQAQRLALARIASDPHVLHLRVLALTPDPPDAPLTKQLPALLTRTRMAAAQGEAAIALARCGTEEGLRVLLTQIGDPREQDLLRSLAAVGLGRAADLEPIPSLLRLTEGLNYRCMTDLTNTLLSIY